MPYNTPEKRAAYVAKIQKTARWKKLHAKWQTTWRLKNLEKRRAWEAEYARKRRRKLRGENFGKYPRKKTDAEKLATKRASRRRFYAAHRDEIRAATKQARIDNPERFRKVDQARYARDPEKRIHASVVQRAKRGGQECYLPLPDWQNLLHRFHHRCTYCGILLTKKNRSLDHRIPLVRGGTNDIENFAPACRLCNSRKNTKTEAEFRSLLQSNNTSQ